MPMNGKFSIYIHIPFCSKKCPYCHFYVVKENERLKALYLEAIRQEIAMRSPFKKELVSLYFGGGTPSLFSPDEIASIIDIPPHVEVTLEANPEDVSLEKMRAYRDLGINRISLGIQSFDETLLTLLGRGHLAKMGFEAIETTFRAGFDNISIDLMYDLPGQTLESFEKSLLIASSLPISHLSLYNLTIEPHTSFFKREKELRTTMPDESLSLKLLQMAVKHLESAGLKRYEISAFGKKSIHNSGYWEGRPFLGFGPSAYSDWDQSRFQNSPNIIDYAKKIQNGEFPITFSEKLSFEARQRELLAIGLRLLEGVIYNGCAEKEVAHLISQNLLEYHMGRLRLTDQGALLYDTVAEEIIHVSTDR